MPTIRTILLSTLAIAASACDPAEGAGACPDPHAAIELVGPPDLEPEGITLREQGPPAGLYITTWNGGPIKRAEFVAAIKACNKQSDPPATLTLSWYQPDTAKQERVLGLGESVMADQKLWECYVAVFKAQNPVAF